MTLLLPCRKLFTLRAHGFGTPTGSIDLSFKSDNATGWCSTQPAESAFAFCWQTYLTCVAHLCDNSGHRKHSSTNAVCQSICDTYVDAQYRIVLQTHTHVSQIIRRCASVEFQHMCSREERYCAPVLSTHVANCPRLRVCQFSERVGKWLTIWVTRFETRVLTREAVMCYCTVDTSRQKTNAARRSICNTCAGPSWSSRIGLRFASADATGRCSVTLSGACAGAHGRSGIYIRSEISKAQTVFLCMWPLILLEYANRVTVLLALEWGFCYLHFLSQFKMMCITV